MYIVTAKTKQTHPQSHLHVVIGHDRQGLFKVNELCTETHFFKILFKLNSIL